MGIEKSPREKSTREKSKRWSRERLLYLAVGILICIIGVVVIVASR